MKEKDLIKILKKEFRYGDATILGNKLGVSPSYMSKLIGGNKPLSRKMYEKLLDYAKNNGLI